MVAQNDLDLAAEWAPSNFDRRHQVSSDVMWELPFGPNRRWLANGGFLAGLIGEWGVSATFAFQSGSPLTARVVGSASDVARGTNGSLRADYTGAPIQLGHPTINEFFNTAAFAVPAAGGFGTSARNMIIGPDARQLNMSLNRDMRLGGSRSLTLTINVRNLLNTAQWAGIDTNLNSATLGEVLSVRPMRSITVGARVRF